VPRLWEQRAPSAPRYVLRAPFAKVSHGYASQPYSPKCLEKVNSEGVCRIHPLRLSVDVSPPGPRYHRRRVS
jgi:hypothetical protein